ncbi:DUF4493 domain-containing protein [Arenibacter palladensis]|uniref:DUF4493 domain-containing protein n=1 Tax=Arenibacter palladensis TaxID=237373 RepID=UPI0026E23CBD|nr:DUF4493 domain-containing protein [Arenibacter palladensis]MDO6602032.1 DUF4493 domain-containing protein [Arenibacter palladensis]
MKAKLIFGMLILGLFFVGCDKDNVLEAIGEPTTIDPIEETEPGFLSLKATVKEIIQITTGKPPLEDVLAAMRIYISNGSEQVYNRPYNESPETIELPAGFYNLLIGSFSNYSALDALFNTGSYGYYNSSVLINSGAITTINANLALLDMATTITISPEVSSSFPDIEVDVRKWTNIFGSNEKSELTWNTAQSGQTGYFMTYDGDWITGTLGDQGGDLEISITATNNSGLPVTASKWYMGISANEHYNISIEQNEITTGLNLIVTLNDEVIIDDIIIFPN